MNTNLWRKPGLIALGPLTIGALLPVGWRFDLFHTTAWYDVLLHFLGGFFLIVTFTGLLLRRGGAAERFAACGRRAAPALAAAVLLISTGWEIMEVPLHMTPNWSQSKADTISDMLWAQGGAAAALRLIHGRRRRTPPL